MEENENKEELKNEEATINTEELKKEASETVGKVKDTIKDLRIKDETMNTRNFVKEMVKDPITKTSEITKDKDNKFLKTSIFMIIIWTLSELIYAVFSYIDSYGTIFRRLLKIVKVGISPAVIVLTLTLIIFILNKKKKKSLTTVLSTVVSVYLPMIVASVVHLLYLIDYQMAKITTPVTTLATFITIILSYFAIKNIFEEETDLATLKKFVLVEAIYFGVAIIASFLGISMYL